MSRHQEVEERMQELLHSARLLISAIEESVPNPYSAQGFYQIFAAGFLPVPYLWQKSEEFQYAMDWKTKLWKGSMRVVGLDGKPMATRDLVERAKCHLCRAT